MLNDPISDIDGGKSDPDPWSFVNLNCVALLLFHHQIVPGRLRSVRGGRAAVGRQLHRRRRLWGGGVLVGPGAELGLHSPRRPGKSFMHFLWIFIYRDGKKGM